ncbi:hypothetical protein KSP40_PGU009976 [Platanthera guangdongensis]|uniref:DUF4005 domain-containing protein n=1 Tax=Platanthera guangdongensis TaxID=2320717 RepID=A0ABR2MM81_9ASPA
MGRKNGYSWLTAVKKALSPTSKASGKKPEIDEEGGKAQFTEEGEAQMEFSQVPKPRTAGGSKLCSAAGEDGGEEAEVATTTAVRLTRPSAFLPREYYAAVIIQTVFRGYLLQSPPPPLISHSPIPCHAISDRRRPLAEVIAQDASTPNYMTATESAMARLRSRSVPRQSPERERPSTARKRLSFPAPEAHSRNSVWSPRYRMMTGQMSNVSSSVTESFGGRCHRRRPLISGGGYGEGLIVDGIKIDRDDICTGNKETCFVATSKRRE